MEHVVDRFVQKHQLLTKESTVVVGVSGGPDSMALLHYILNRKQSFSLQIVVAHVNHMLRGNESLADYEYVEQFCRNCNILFEGAHIDVNAYKKEHQLTTQVAARKCRYQFFSEVMKKYSAECLALGHHGDDQIETMLMRQTRGAIGFARAGIPVKRPFANGTVIRPLLCLEKAEIEHYIKQAGIEPRRDPSNEENDYMRNRFRHTVLPFLKRENPKVHERFQQQSEDLYSDEQVLMEEAERLFDIVVERHNQDELIVDVQRFLSIAIALQRRVVQLILNCLYQSDFTYVTNVHIDQIIHLFMNKHPSRTLHLPANLYVIRSYNRVTFTFTMINKKREFSFRVQPPFEINLPCGKLTGKISDTMPEVLNPNVFVGDAHAFEWPLTVRTRKPGDRMHPQGMDGSKKLKSIFIDEKIERQRRDFIPVIEDASGKIIWIPSVKRAKFGLVSNETRKFLFLSYEMNDGFSLSREDTLQHGK